MGEDGLNIAHRSIAVWVSVEQWSPLTNPKLHGSEGASKRKGKGLDLISGTRAACSLAYSLSDSRNCSLSYSCTRYYYYYHPAIPTQDLDYNRLMFPLDGNKINIPSLAFTLLPKFSGRLLF